MNGASEDFDPRLIVGEDGILRVTWLSNRRGRGWEVWVSALENDAPHRIPLEKWANPGVDKTFDHLSTLLEYDVMQDRRGWWMVCYYARSTGELVFLRSR